MSKEVEEHRRVVAVNNETSASRSQPPKRRSRSLSPSRYRSPRPHHSSVGHSRYHEMKHSDDKAIGHNRYKDNSDRERSSERSSDRKKKYQEKDGRKYPSTSSLRIREHQSHSRDDRRPHSDDREGRMRERDAHHRSRSERSHHEYRDKSRDRSQERRTRDRSRDHRVHPHYYEPVPVPVYYGNFQPRPIMVGPMVPYRGQVPYPRGRAPPGMGPTRPFQPRFVPPEMIYRLGPPPNPRFGPMY